MVSLDDDIVSFLREMQKRGHNQLLNIIHLKVIVFVFIKNSYSYEVLCLFYVVLQTV